MIKITVELVSANGRDHDKLLGVGVISNVGGDAQFGDYSVWLSKMAPQDRAVWKQGRGRLTADDYQQLFETDVTRFDREKRGCWDLLFIALRQLVASRNPPPAHTQAITSSRLRTPRR